MEREKVHAGVDLVHELDSLTNNLDHTRFVDHNVVVAVYLARHTVETLADNSWDLKRRRTEGWVHKKGMQCYYKDSIRVY